ncbi:class I SAM-dependent methyltransferase [Pseudoalteromonas sp. SMS1]|uniref:class I SAM-dependent methyltransferase n=1 Tax=Pseudoalteromonas sp. SMS1 TaxID=2908894 RepID=UPI001F311941|nr:class I SAM-dependent methyltransferase [Pseudoalteromonas sp. SMS1]MCF2859370.1 class I SAM-dependent methyltransferase [Pseudoalteromonas sp. SMS1]
MSHHEKKQAWHQQASDSDVKKQVGRLADDITWQKLADNINLNLQLNSQTEILDVGCGNGYLLSLLDVDKNLVYGIDFAENMVKEAKERFPHGHFAQSEACHIPYNKKFSRVLCYSIFHYFPSQSYVEQVLTEFIEHTESGGMILIGDLLDKQFEQEIKQSSDQEIEAAIPIIHRYSQWLFVDVTGLVKWLENDGRLANVEIRQQPKDFKLSWYRKDLLITLK